MENNPLNQESQSGVNSLLVTLRSLAQKGDFNGIGKIVSRLDAESNEVGAVLSGLCWEANTFKAVLEQGIRFKTASVIIEALVQRKQSVALLKIGGISWRGQDSSPISERCLQAALDLGPLDELFDEIQRWPISASSAELERNKREFSALAIIGIAERRYHGAFLCAAQILRDGDGCKTDLTAARMYFHRFALNIIGDASSNLKLAGEAFAELVKLADTKKSGLHNFYSSFYSTMLEVANTASKHLSPMLPGDEFEIILGLPEASKLEFKSSARWDYKELKVNKDLEHSVIKTISAFMNTEGGVLIIGISDDKQLLGLEPDYKTFGNLPPNQDGFRRFLTELISKEIGEHRSPFYSVSLINFQNKEFCRVEVKKSLEPVFIKRKGQETLYVRIDNKTQPIQELSKVEAWLKQRALASAKSPKS